MDETKEKFNKTAYKNQFSAENYDRINLAVPKGNREKYREHSKKYGYNSLNDFAVKSMENQVEKDIKQSEEEN